MKSLHSFLVNNRVKSNGAPEDFSNKDAVIDYIKSLSDGVENISIRMFSKPEDPNIEAWVRFDYLPEEKWPNHIADNSIFLTFTIENGSVETIQIGHLELTDADRAGKYKYFALKSFTAPLLDNGGKRFRKYRYKSVEDLCKKMSDYANQVYEAALKDQGGKLERK